jgi:phasin family protein
VLKRQDKAAPEAAPKAAVEQPKAQMPVASGVKGDDRLARFGKDGLQVYVRTGSIMVKGFEDFSREIAVYAQAALEVNVAAAKAMAQAGSFDEMLDLQTKAAHESIDIMLAEGAKLTELSLDLANKSMEPLHDQVDKTVATLLKPIAA